MDNFRLILILALIFILLMLYQEWQKDYGPKPPVATTPKTENTSTPSSPGSEPKAPDSELPSIEDLATPTTEVTTELPTSQIQQPLTSQSRIFVETDVLKVEIDTKGGDIRQVFLLDYPVSRKTPDQPFRLMNDQLPNLLVAQTGLLSEQRQAPTHQNIYQAEQSHYRLSQSVDQLEVKLIWSQEQVMVSKIYTFHRNSYLVDLKHIIENKATDPWQGRLYGQFQRTPVSEPGQSRFIYTYLGGAISTPDSLYEKISFDEMKDDSLNQRPGWAGGWIAMLQHYFVTAWIPERDEVYRYSSKVFSNSRYALQLIGPVQTVEPNDQHTFKLKLYVGPKLQHQLAKISPGLDLTVDYGWLWFIAQPLFWALEYIYSWVSNWGWAIILLTILIKLAFFHLSATSYKSMANMRRLHPRLVALKDRYGDDKARLNQAMMDLYKKEKINPLGGCLPILVQIPVFIALYWVLLESVELRQASFIFWLNDLSTPDPYFVLPIIMGVTMLLQHYLNPAPIDPVQQKVMLVLPFVFTVFFAFFPSGLVLYWVVNNVLSIAQQWVITKKIAGNV